MVLLSSVALPWWLTERVCAALVAGDTHAFAGEDLCLSGWQMQTNEKVLSWVTLDIQRHWPNLPPS